MKFYPVKVRVARSGATRQVIIVTKPKRGYGRVLNAIRVDGPLREAIDLNAVVESSTRKNTAEEGK
jgi:hypothetical protein